MSIINKSGVMPWSSINIDGVPDVAGVYTLRTSTTIESILYIGSAGAGRLKERLQEHYRTNDVPGTRYFDWYQTENEDEARRLEKQWINTYNPPYNT